MDSLRKKIFPNPTYSDEERDAAYRAFVMMGSLLASNGVATLLDGVAHKRIWRDLAREECPKFIEVYVKCPIENLHPKRNGPNRGQGTGKAVSGCPRAPKVRKENCRVGQSSWRG